MRCVIPPGSTHLFQDVKAPGPKMMFAAAEPVLSSRGRKMQEHFVREKPESAFNLQTTQLEAVHPIRFSVRCVNSTRDAGQRRGSAAVNVE